MGANEAGGVCRDRGARWRWDLLRQERPFSHSRLSPLSPRLRQLFHTTLSTTLSTTLHCLHASYIDIHLPT